MIARPALAETIADAEALAAQLLASVGLAEASTVAEQLAAGLVLTAGVSETVAVAESLTVLVTALSLARRDAGVVRRGRGRSRSSRHSSRRR
jgi:hypothetical protein